MGNSSGRPDGRPIFVSYSPDQRGFGVSCFGGALGGVLGFCVVLFGFVAAFGFDLSLGLALVVPLPVSVVVLVPVGVPMALLEPVLVLLRAGARPAMVMLSSTLRFPAYDCAMRLAVSFSFAVGALPISVMLLSVTATWMLAWLSVGSFWMALSISDFSAAGSEAGAAGVVVKLPLPVIEPELVCPMGTALSPLWLEGGGVLAAGAVVPPTAVEFPVVEPVPVAPVCAPMEPFGLVPVV